MNVKIARTVYEDVDIDETAAKKITIQFLSELIKIKAPGLNGYSYKIDEATGGLVMYWENGGGHHSWTESQTVKSAKNVDELVKAVMVIFDKLKANNI